MKELFIKILLSIVIMFATILNVKAEIANGTSGTCEWSIDDSGQMRIFPSSGDECTLAESTTLSSASFNTHRSQITSIVFEGKVYTNTNASFLFSSMSNLTSFDSTNLDTSLTTNMSYLFNIDINLKNLDLSHFDTSNVTNMQNMFYRCSSLKSLDLSNFDTSSVTNMKNMFCNCTSLTTLDMSNFSSASLTGDALSYFMHGENFKEIKLGNKFSFYDPGTDNVNTFGRGQWLRQEDGKLYNAVDIVLNSKTKDVSGTYTYQRNTVENMNPSYLSTYILDFSLDNLDVSSITYSNPDIFTFHNNYFYMVNIKNITQSNYTVNESVELMFIDAAVDALGNKYDVKVKMDNFKLYDFDKIDTSNGFYYQFYGITHHASHVYKTINLSNEMNASTAYDVTINVLDKSGNPVEGNYTFSAYDLDISSARNDNGVLDGLNYGLYSEGINLISGYDISTLKMYDNTFLRTKNLTDAIRIYGTHLDLSSELTEFNIKVNASEFKYSWTGYKCGTMVLTSYQPNIVEIEKTDNNGRKVEGISLGIYNSNNELVEQFTTTSENKKLFLLSGRYTLKEMNYPEYYTKGNDIVFYIDNVDGLTINGKTAHKIELVNTLKKYNYTVNYLDKDTNKKIHESKIAKSEYNNTIISNDEIIKINGYKYNSVDKESITISVREEDNVINIYYNIINPSTGLTSALTTLVVIMFIAVGILIYNKNRNKMQV